MFKILSLKYDYDDFDTTAMFVWNCLKQKTFFCESSKIHNGMKFQIWFVPFDVYKYALIIIV